MATKQMPDWASLYDREPAIKPPRLEVVPSIDPARPDHAPWGQMPEDDRDEALGAICAYFALRWLAVEAGVKIIGPHGPDCARCAGQVEVVFTTGVKSGDGQRREARADTLEEALFMACDAVLKAEGR